MVSKRNLYLQNIQSFEIGADCYIPSSSKSNKKFPIVIFSHGFKGFKDWGGFPYLMQKLSGAGFVSVSFNFSHNGVEKNTPTEFTRLDLFAQNTFSKELDDLGIVIDYFYENAGEYNADKNKIALIGHSRGGGISILKANEDKRIKCLITLASVSTFDRYTEEHKILWRKKGCFEVINTRTNQMMRLNSTLLDDLDNNKSRLDIVKASRALDKPTLIIHGKEDLSVKYSEAETIYRNSSKGSAELFLIENTGHTFGTVHPFEGSQKAFEKVIEKIIAFLRKYL